MICEPLNYVIIFQSIIARTLVFYPMNWHSSEAFERWWYIPVFLVWWQNYTTKAIWLKSKQNKPLPHSFHFAFFFMFSQTKLTFYISLYYKHDFPEKEKCSGYEVYIKPKRHISDSCDVVKRNKIVMEWAVQVLAAEQCFVFDISQILTPSKKWSGTWCWMQQNPDLKAPRTVARISYQELWKRQARHKNKLGRDASITNMRSRRTLWSGLLNQNCSYFTRIIRDIIQQRSRIHKLNT